MLVPAQSSFLPQSKLFPLLLVSSSSSNTPTTPRSHARLPSRASPPLNMNTGSIFFQAHSTALQGSRSLFDSILKQLQSSTTTTLLSASLATFLVGFLTIFWRYRRAIRSRIRELKEESWIFGTGLTMTRSNETRKNEDKPEGLFHNLKLLALVPEYERKIIDGIQLVSLGNYMSTLKPKQKLPENVPIEGLRKTIQREIEAGLATALLQALGPSLGRALLPTLGFGPVQRAAQKLATTVSADWIVQQNQGEIQSSSIGSEDKAGLPLSFLSLLAFSEINAKTNKPTSDDNGKDTDENQIPGSALTAMDKMKRGEVVAGLSFADFDDFPNDFVVERHFENFIHKMEDRLSKGNCDIHESTEERIAKSELRRDNENSDDNRYDPEDRSMGPSIPLNPRLLPDLHLGYGDIKCSHTKREVLRMRLISLLLNRLGSNYFETRKGNQPTFSVRMKPGDQPVYTPSAFVEMLIQFGHSVQVLSTSRLTTFGLGMCIQERDGSFSQIPMGVFIESGYEDRQGRMAPAMMPHSGVNMYISGPIAGKRKDGTKSVLSIQHFIGIEGFCGWKSDGIPMLPYCKPVSNGLPIEGTGAIRATMLAALYANVLNGLATDLNLPFGGYGATAVCNDSAAILQQTLTGTCTIFPLTSIGKYMLRTMRFAQNLRDDFVKTLMHEESSEMGNLIIAMKSLPNDVNPSPSNQQGAAKRLLHTLPEDKPFVLMNESVSVMESILKEED